MTQKPPVVSYTSLDTYAKCSYCYKLKYIDKVSQEEADFTGAVPGLVSHKLAEQFFEKKNIDGLIDWDLFENNFEVVFRKYLNSPNVHLGSDAFAKNEEDARVKIKTWRDNLMQMLKTHEMVKNITISEFRFGSYKNPLQLTDKLLFTGGPDLFSSDSMDKPGILVDFKASDSAFHVNEKQLFLYTLALQKELNVKVSMAGFFLFKSMEAIWKVVTKDKLDETIAWAESIVDGILAEKYNPTPSQASCRLCPFKTVCEHSSYRLAKPSAIKSISALQKEPNPNFQLPQTPEL